MFLIIVFGILTNTIINQHFHKLSSGQIVKHAHPYEKKNTGAPFQDHHHSSSELVLFEQISNIAFWICLFLAFTTILSGIITTRKIIHAIDISTPDLYFLRNYHAPPALSY